jgi:lipid-binding SYLF domain-containing protein
MRAFAIAASLCVSCLPVLAAETATQRLQAATDVFNDVMATPDKGIPQELLEKAHCVVIVPGLKKGAFVVGAQYGKGFAVCRKSSGAGWGDPAAVRVEGGSFGFQIGGSETDVVMLLMNAEGMRKLEHSKFTVGADASVAAGPVGRTASANTDAYMRAEILSWSRARGLFAGIALNGATLRPDEDANRELYGSKMDTRQVFESTAPKPEGARALDAALSKYSMHEEGTRSNADRQDNANKSTRRERDKQ